MKSQALLLCICIAVISCSKDQSNASQHDISFELNSKHVTFDHAIVSAQPFCGERLYSIAAANNDETFLISIVTDTLRSATYTTGFNYWYQGGGITSSAMRVTITDHGASFFDDSLHIHGTIAHKL